MGEFRRQGGAASHQPIDPLEGDLQIVDNPDEARYEARLDGRLVGLATYRLEPGRIVFIHTEIMPALEGRGVGSRLAAGALDAAREAGRAVVPRCPFIRAYIRGHPVYADLLAHDKAHRDDATGDGRAPAGPS